MLSTLARRRRFRTAQQRLARWLDPDPDEVARYQLERLRTVWAEAIVSVPYYRNLVASGAAPRVIRSLREFFTEVPLLTRERIMAAPELFERAGRPADRYAVTAGSTGNPLRFGLYRGENASAGTNLLVGRIANGMEIHDRVFLLWGHSHLLGTGVRGLGKHAVRKVKDRLLGYHRSNAYRLDPSSARAHMQALLSFQPKILIGYSTALDMLVRYNAGAADVARRLGMRFVVATAEVLPRSDTREIIEDFFGCPLVMEYGGVEFGAVAYTAPAGPYAVFWWDCLVEAGAEGVPERNPVVVTNLYPQYFPLIRYHTGDEIRDARRLPDGQVVGFDEVCGRHNDVVRLDDGSVVHSVGVFHCIHQEPEVYNIQLVVETGGPRLLLVARIPDPQILARIRRRLRDLSPALESCPIQFVPDLVTNRAGKRRWIVDRRG